MGDAVDHFLHGVVRKDVADGAGVVAGGGEQHVGDGRAEVLNFVIDAEASEFERDFSHQAVAVGVKSTGGDADYDVVGGNVATVDNAIALDHANGETGKVVAAVLEHVGQDGRFAA